MSSRNDPNETMNGFVRSASAAFHAGGAANTGLASSTSSSWVAGAAASRSRSDRAGGDTDRGRHEGDAARDLDAADQRVQRVDGQRLVEPVGVGQPGPADDRDRRPVRGELAGDPLDACGGDPGPLFDLGRRERRQPGRPALDDRPGAAGAGRRRQAIAQDDVGQPQGHGALGARPHRQPFVGAGPGLRNPWLDLDELGADRLLAPHAPVGGVLRQRRVPGAEEVGAEADDVARSREIEGRQLVAAEAERVGAAADRVVEELERHRRRSTEPLQELRHQRRPAAAPRPAEEADRTGLTLRHQGSIRPARSASASSQETSSKLPLPRSPLRRSGAVRRSG